MPQNHFFQWNSTRESQRLRAESADGTRMRFQHPRALLVVAQFRMDWAMPQTQRADSQRNLIEQARDAGALAYLVKPFQKSELLPNIEMALGRFAEMKALDDQVRNLEERLEVRKSLDRAKGILMDELGWKEREAFTWIQRTAMRERLAMAEISNRIISGELRPDPKATG